MLAPVGEREFIQEVNCFLKGGVPGAARLKEVLSTLFCYFKILTSNSKANALIKCGLIPYKTTSDVTFVVDGCEKTEVITNVSFFFAGCDVRDQFKAPKDYGGFDWDDESHCSSQKSDRMEVDALHEVGCIPPPPPSVSWGAECWWIRCAGV